MLLGLFFALLIILDVFIIWGYIQVKRKLGFRADALLDITEERRLIEIERAKVEDALKFAKETAESVLKKATHMGAQIEKEVGAASQVIASNLDAMIADLSTHFEKPLSQLAERQRSLEVLNKKVETSRERLASLTNRAYEVAKFFKSQLSYEELSKNIEDQKYQEARSLLAKGMAPAQISKQLGMPLSELSVLASVR